MEPKKEATAEETAEFIKKLLDDISKSEGGALVMNAIHTALKDKPRALELNSALTLTLLSVGAQSMLNVLVAMGAMTVDDVVNLNRSLRG